MCEWLMWLGSAWLWVMVSILAILLRRLRYREFPTSLTDKIGTIHKPTGW